MPTASTAKEKSIRFPDLLVVEASAGSGKTEALARRYLQFILAPQTAIPHNQLFHILAITFTNKAAREMKERILSSLKKLALEQDAELSSQILDLVAIRPEDLPGQARQKIDQIIEHYSDFQVRTIDSFANRVIHAAALELGLRPEVETTTTYAELLDYALSLLLKEVGPGGDAEVTRMMGVFLEVLNETSPSSFAWDPASKLRETWEGFLREEGKETGHLVCDDHHQKIQDCVETIGRTYREIISQGFEKDKRQKGFEEALDRKDIRGLLEKVYSERSFPLLKASIPKEKEILAAELKRKWVDLHRVANRLADLYAEYRFFPFVRAYGLFKKRLEKAQKLSGILHVDDVPKRLIGYLNQEIIPDVYVRLGERLYHFLIDEFQDTDPLQWRSLDPLLRECLSKDGSLFLAGDLKQAIYMFRRADFRIMKGVLEDIRRPDRTPAWLPASVQETARIKTLPRNHRSGGVICQYVDDLFKKRLKALQGQELFPEDMTGLTNFEQEVMPEKVGKGYVRVMLFRKASKQEGEDGEEMPERQALLNIIRDVHHSRGIPYRDIAILAKKNKELETLVDWLTAEGIPAAASSALDIRKRRVVAEMVELLKFLNSPVDDLAFAHFVGGQIMAQAVAGDGSLFGPKELSGLLVKARAQGGGTSYLYQVFRQDERCSPLWERYFDDLYEKTGYYPLYDLVSLALRTFRVFEHFPQESGPLVKLLESINALESRGQNSIRDFLACMSQEQEELFAISLPEYTDAVRLLTFHKAKGLDFPVVINVLYESSPPRDAWIYGKRDEEIRVYYAPEDIRDRSPGVNEIWKNQRLDEGIQFLNTLYVACTRPQDELYNVVVTNTKGEDKLLCSLFEECELGQRPRRLSGGESEPPQPTPVEMAGALTVMSGPKPGESWSYARWLEARRGEAYHHVLEEIEFLPEELEKEIAAALQRCRCFQVPVDEEQVKTDILTFLSVVKVKEWFLPAANRRMLREAEFVDRFGALHRMDRVILDQDQVTVVDFKTGERKDYSGQVKAYMEILKQVFPGRTIKGYVAYVDSRIMEEIG